MTDEQNCEFVNLLEEDIKTFIGEWKKEPWKWLQEIDIQTDLANRFHGIALNFPPFEGFHSLFEKRFNEKKPLNFSRVTCEPYVKYPSTQGYVRPDIVVWKDTEKPQHIDSGVHPILWVCEIKYDEGFDKEDFNRLNTMKEDGKIDKGCAIRLHLCKNKQACKPELSPILSDIKYIEEWLS